MYGSWPSGVVGVFLDMSPENVEVIAVVKEIHRAESNKVRALHQEGCRRMYRYRDQPTCPLRQL
jgi:hypothetical protein